MRVWFPYVYAGTGSDVFTKVLANMLRRRGHEVTVSCYAHAWQYFPWRLRLATAPTGTDAVIANSWNGFSFKRPGIPLIVVEHLFVLDPALSPYRSFAQSIFHNSLVRYFVSRSYRAADTVVALSQYAHQRMSSSFPSIDPVIIPNGIDTDFFTPPIHEKKPLDGRKVKLLFVGNPTRRKGGDLLPKIIQELGSRFELGYTSGLRANDPYQRRPGMVSLGKLDHEGTRSAYRAADLLLFPSRLEGLPLVVMEALACGTPAIVSNTSSLPEMIEDGVNGRVCAKDDVTGIANAIKNLAANPKTLSRMRQAARLSAETNFSLTRMVQDYESLLMSLTDKFQDDHQPSCQ